MEKSKKRKLDGAGSGQLGEFSVYSKSKRQKRQNVETEYIVVKIEPIEMSNDNGPNEEMSQSKCPKCSISYKSKASMKNHIQVCRSELQKQVD